MIFGYFFAGLFFSIVFSLFLYRVPVSDGYDSLALLAVMITGFDFGINFLDSRLKYKIIAGLFLGIISTCTLLSFTFSPYFLGGGFLFLMIRMLLGWYQVGNKTVKSKIYAVFAGFSAGITAFISFYYV